MKITVNGRTVFRFPTGMIFNSLTAGIVKKSLKKDGINLTRKQTAMLIKEIKRYRRTHADWYLVEVYEKSGEVIRVKI